MPRNHTIILTSFAIAMVLSLPFASHARSEKCEARPGKPLVEIARSYGFDKEFTKAYAWYLVIMKIKPNTFEAREAGWKAEELLEEMPPGQMGDVAGEIKSIIERCAGKL